MANKDGTYNISGSIDSVTTIDPQIHVKHNCESEHFRQCHKFDVPKRFVTRGPIPQSIYDAGTLELKGTDNNC